MIATKDPYTLHRLANGLQIVIEQMPDVRSAAAGFLVRTGARDETPELAGVSHFLEHMMFKGTAQRGWREINIDFDRMGSSYNAYTSEERTVYYGWVRQGDIARQLELLSDMMRSVIPEAEFTMEKNVILEEIAMAKDSLEHVAIDFLQERLFAGHSLAWPVLGYEQTIRDLTRDQMWGYFQQRYAPDNMMLVVAGNVDPAMVIGVAEELCGEWQPSGTSVPRVRPKIHSGVDVQVVDRFAQQIVVLSFPSVSAPDPFTETASAVATILGGENSRCFWNMVQSGVSLRAGAFHMDYTDCGALLMYGVGLPDQVERIHDALRIEAKRIGHEPVQPHEIERVKNRRRTSLAIESEAPYHRLTQLFDDMDFHGAPRSVEQMLLDVDAVSQNSISAYLEQYPLDAPGHLASVGPRPWPLDQPAGGLTT